MPSNEREFAPVAAVLAWLWPGLGHISLGQRKRGLLIMFGVLFLFVSGIWIGGLDVVDRKRDMLWFIAQVFNGPIALAADFANQRLLPRLPAGWATDPVWIADYQEQSPEIRDQLRATSLGKVNEIGTLYVALAGLMNLVVILDALHPLPRRDGDRA